MEVKQLYIDIIGFICGSLCSSTVQLHDSVGSRCTEAGFNSQIAEHASGVYYWRAAFCFAFLWAKGCNAKDVYKEMFPVYIGKHLLHKAVRNWVADFSLMMKRLKWRCGSAWDNSQKLMWCGFLCTGKAMGQVYQCWWRIFWEINVYSRFEYHVLRFVSICDLFIYSPSYKLSINPIFNQTSCIVTNMW
jgi:hypothetical protein